MNRLRSALTIPREKLSGLQTPAHIAGVVAAVLGIVSLLFSWTNMVGWFRDSSRGFLVIFCHAPPS